MLSKKYIPLYLIILLACLYLVLKNNTPLEDKQYDKEYTIPSNYGSEVASPTYSLPSQCKKLLADLEKTSETSGSGTFMRTLATWNRLCGFYIDNKEKIKVSAKHDFISLVDLYNLPLNQFPYRCDITTTIHNEESWNGCLESIKAGTTIMDILAANLDVDETTCRFINGQGPDGLYVNKKENKVYCGNPATDKRYTEHGQSHTISPPPFSEAFTYSDYDGDGYMDAALTYSGREDICSSCGSSGVVFFTKKSKEGKIESILVE